MSVYKGAIAPGITYTEINAVLREGKAAWVDRLASGYLQKGSRPYYGSRTEIVAASSTVERTTKLLDSVLSKATTPAPSVVYRGIQGGAKSLNLKVGKVFVDKGFVSTSTSKSVADKFGGTRLTIRLPKGQRGYHMPVGVGFGRGEKEFLLPRGTKFRVAKVKGRNITLEAVP